MCPFPYAYNVQEIVRFKIFRYDAVRINYKHKCKRIIVVVIPK